MYRIAQLTDVHIGQAGEDTFGVDVRSNFKRVLAQALRDGADEVLITGDLAYRSGEPDIYAWIAEQLDAVSTPCWVLPGNHDDVAMMQEAFGKRMYARTVVVRDIGARRLIFVDSSAGSVDEAQRTAVAEYLSDVSASPLVFLHHPPALLGVPYMDDGHALQNHEQVLDVLRGASTSVHVFCGHYHVERSLQVDSVSIFATPSTFFQIDPRHASFVVDHRMPAYRSITFDDLHLQTAVRWLPQSPES